MATVQGGQVILNNGQRVTPQTGGWYDGQQFWGGTLSNPGQFNGQNNQSGQQGAAPVQNTNDAAYLAKIGDTTAPNRVVTPTNNAPTSAANPGTYANPNAAAPPVFDLVAATQAAYNTPEITAANQAITDVNGKITAREKELADAQAGINDNPFFSEATRFGKSAKLSDQANNEIGVLQNQSAQAATQLATLKSDAAIKINAAQGQYNINKEAYADTLRQFQTILSAGGLTNASPQDLANYAVATGIPVSALQSIQKQEQDANVKTQIIPSTDDNGNVTITAVDSKTGQIISQSTAGDISKSTKKASTTVADAKITQQNVISEVYDTFRRIAGPEGYVSKEDWAKMKSAVLSSGTLSSSEFNSQFASFTNPNNNNGTYTYN